MFVMADQKQLNMFLQVVSFVVKTFGDNLCRRLRKEEKKYGDGGESNIPKLFPASLSLSFNF